MSKLHHQNQHTSTPMIYQIRVEGHLGPEWTDWFDGLALTLEDHGETLLTGLVLDQSALHGLLRKIRDLGMPLISVQRLDSEPKHNAKSATCS